MRSRSYNINLIWNYINGDEVLDILKLENDYKFMRDVINISKDKNMYNLCSDNVKKNREFVHFLIDKFRGDWEFVIMVANNYLKSLDENDYEYMNFIVYMASVLEGVECLESKKISYAISRYRVMASCYITNQKSMIDLAISSVDDRELLEMLGLGFGTASHDIAFEDKYECDSFAKLYLEDIFGGNLGELENFIHQNFKSVEMFKNWGESKFLIDYVRYWDDALCDYVEGHVYLLDNARKILKTIIKNWDIYEMKMLGEKQKWFRELARKQIQSYDTIYNYSDWCSYLKKIIPNIDKYLQVDCEYEVMNLPTDVVNINDYKCLKELLDLARAIFLENHYHSRGVVNKQSMSSSGEKVIYFTDIVKRKRLHK